MNTVKACGDMGLTQFDLSKILLNNLNNFDLTAGTKLVLMVLADCYNPLKKEIFPKQKTIADKLGVSEPTVKRAIKELTSKNYIMYLRKGSNRYTFTQQFFTSIKMIPKKIYDDKMIPAKYQNDTQASIKMIPHEQIKEKKEEQNSFSKKSFRQSDYRSKINDSGPTYQEFKPQKIEAQSPMDMTKEQAIEFIKNMPAEVQKVSTFAKQLKQKWGLGEPQGIKMIPNHYANQF